MMQIGEIPDDLSPSVQDAWGIVQSGDRSRTALERLQAIAAEARGNDVAKIERLIEAFIASAMRLP